MRQAKPATTAEIADLQLKVLQIPKAAKYQAQLKECKYQEIPTRNGPMLFEEAQTQYQDDNRAQKKRW